MEEETKFCKFCGAKIPMTAVLCTACGRQVEELKSAESSQPNIVINNSKILNNTADNYYGGIYHCAAGFSVLGNTRIAGNKNEGFYGGGVYLKKTCMYLSGNVQVYGNYSNGHPCDVNFGKCMDEAFRLEGYMEQDAMIGV